jgi:hypothetical protein
MTDERDKQVSGNDDSAPTTGQDSDKSEYGARGQDSSDDGMRGQPIGGNDSNTGTGTSLTQGADFDRESAAGQGFILRPADRAENEEDTVSTETGFSGGSGSNSD